MKKNITLLYGFSFFDQFMIVIALWVPYLATQGIGMQQFTVSAILPSNARSRRVAERGGARADGQMHVVGLAWDRWV